MPAKNRKTKAVDELRPKYDIRALQGGVRGKYFRAATAGTTMVSLEPGRSGAIAVKPVKKPARAVRT